MRGCLLIAQGTEKPGRLLLRQEGQAVAAMEMALMAMREQPGTLQLQILVVAVLVVETMVLLLAVPGGLGTV